MSVQPVQRFTSALLDPTVLARRLQLRSVKAFWKGLTLLALALVFVTDAVTPLGFAHGTLYPLIILLAALTQDRRWVVSLAVVSLGLTGLGFWLSPLPDAPFPWVYLIVNRWLSATVTLSTATLAILVLNAFKHLRTAHHTLATTHQDLQEQQQLLRIASIIGRLGGWRVDLGTEQLLWSEEVARIHEVEPEFTPTVDACIQFYAPECRDRIRAVFTACTQDGTPYDEELQIITAKGNRVWIRTIGEAVRNAKGNIIAVQGAFQDISERKETQTLLLQSEQRFGQLADAMPHIVWTAAPDGTIDYASHELRTYTGILEPAPHPYLNCLDLLHPEDREGCLQAWTTAVQTGQPYTFEFRLRRYDGTYRWHLVRAIPIHDQAGQIVKWYGTSTEIHDQKQLAQDAQTLATRLNTILESITEAFMTLDRDWRFTFVNHQAEQLLQRQREHLLGQCIWEQCPEILGSSFQQQYQQAVTQGEPVHFQALYPSIDRWVDVYAYPSSEGLTISCQDITERIALEQQLQQTQRLDSIGQLTGGIAHDFNNLLTVILGNAELLTEMLSSDPRLHPLADMITNAARRGAELTQRLLAFARRQPLEPQCINLNQLIASMEGLLRCTLGEQIQIERVTDDPLWLALADPTQLESAILNLCLNARDAMPRGGQLTIATANVHLDQNYAKHHPSVQPGMYVMIAISDTGNGIDPKHLRQVFEPFFTTKATGKGTGLGLSMVYGFMQQSNGHITLDSELHQGTTVRMYLPRYQGAATLAAPPADSGPTSPPSATILLVEDDEFVRCYAQTQLLAMGYHILTAANGSEALAILAQPLDIDLLFTDIVMPGGIDGRTLAEEAQRLRPQLKVLFTSGYAESAIVHHGRLDPGVQLLSKPYRQEELAQKVRDALLQGV